MRGILSWGTHVPYRRLDRTTIAAIAGSGGGSGTRSVASFDEDATTMAVEASRAALSTCSDRSASSRHNTWRRARARQKSRAASTAAAL